MDESNDPHAVNALIADGADAREGRVRWDPVHSLWNGAMLTGTLAFALPLFSGPAFLMFLLMTGAGLLLGHSVGFHRRLIHGQLRMSALARAHSRLDRHRSGNQWPVLDGADPRSAGLGAASGRLP